MQELIRICISAASLMLVPSTGLELARVSVSTDSYCHRRSLRHFKLIPPKTLICLDVERGHQKAGSHTREECHPWLLVLGFPHGEGGEGGRSWRMRLVVVNRGRRKVIMKT